MRYLQGASIGTDSGMSVLHPGMSLPNPGMSLPYPGMSLPYPGMSLPNPGMSLPNPGMSLPIPGMIFPKKAQVSASAPSASPYIAPSRVLPVGAPSPSSTLQLMIKCAPQDMTAQAFIDLRLDVDSLSIGSIFLETLASLTGDMVSYGEMIFSLCQLPGTRMLSEYQTKLDETETEFAVTGLKATASPAVGVGGKFTGHNTQCLHDSQCQNLCLQPFNR